MKVIIKKPNCIAKIIEVEGIKEINKLVGNVDENGEGYGYGGTDIRMFVGEGIDLYCKENAVYNSSLEANLWAPGNNALICGNVVFAGYDPENKVEAGACSLTDEQIEYCLVFISEQTN